MVVVVVETGNVTTVTGPDIWPGTAQTGAAVVVAGIRHVTTVVKPDISPENVEAAVRTSNVTTVTRWDTTPATALLKIRVHAACKSRPSWKLLATL